MLQVRAGRRRDAGKQLLPNFRFASDDLPRRAEGNQNESRDFVGLSLLDQLGELRTGTLEECCLGVGEAIRTCKGRKGQTGAASNSLRRRRSSSRSPIAV